MSLSGVRQYFVNRMKVAGYVEHFDPFDADNVPNTILHKTFFINVGSFEGVKLNQRDQEMRCPIAVRIFLKGYQNVAAAIDAGLEESEKLCQDILKASNRLGNPVKNVTLNRIVPEAFSVTNSSIVIVTMEFTSFVTFNTD